MPGESYSIKHKRKPNSLNEQDSMTELREICFTSEELGKLTHQTCGLIPLH